MKLTTDDLFQLVYHYKTEYNENPFSDAINLAEKELHNVLDDTREYPPFIYYLILINIDNRKRWSNMNKEEKIKAFNDTISNLRKISVS